MDLYEPFLSAAARFDSAPVLALHSSGASSRQWQRVRSALGRRAALVAPDFHGHGAAPAWSGAGRDIAAADVALALRELDAIGRPVHLVGHSYGGAIALEVALRRGHLVRTLTLYEPVAFGWLLAYNPRHAPAREIVGVGHAIARRVRRGEGDEAARLFVTYWSGAAAWEGMVAPARATLAERMSQVAGHFESLFDRAPPLAALRCIERPVMVVTGERMKPPVRRIVELLRAWLPQVGCARIRDAGHMGPVTHPEAFARVLTAFLDTRQPATVAAAPAAAHA